MNVKEFIDYFDDIAHLDRRQQFSLLEQVHMQINQRFKLPVFSLIKVFVPLLFVIADIAIYYLIFGQLDFVLPITMVMALLVARIAANELNAWVMSKGIKRHLSERPAFMEDIR